MTIIDKHSLLTPPQTTLLHSCSMWPFRIGKFNSLDDILTVLKVDVIIEPGKPKRVIRDNFIDEACNRLWEEVKRLECKIKPGDEESIRNYREAFDKASRTIKEMQEYFVRWHEMALRGEYLPDENIIKLYPETMSDEYDGSRMDELLVSTLAHETMHAYFNRPDCKNFPYAPFVEEPLAEFGMLLFLLETNSSYYHWAYRDVASKNTFYRFGAQLMDQYQNGEKQLRNYLERYKIKIDQYDLPIIKRINNRVYISLPEANQSLSINGRLVSLMWQDLDDYAPKYFYDSTTQTLGLDGRWPNYRGGRLHSWWDHALMESIGRKILSKKIKTIYLGDNFCRITRKHFLFTLFSTSNVIVSPHNNEYKIDKGKLVYKNNNKPVLP